MLRKFRHISRSGDINGGLSGESPVFDPPHCPFSLFILYLSFTVCNRKDIKYHLRIKPNFGKAAAHTLKLKSCVS